MEKGEDEKFVRQSFKSMGLWLVTAVVVPSFVAFITAYYIQPWIARPTLDILGAMPIHFYEEEKILFPERTSNNKIYNHRLAIIFKVKNPSSTSAIIHTALIEGCIKIDDNPIVAEGSLPPEEQIELSGKQLDFSYERHKHTVQSIRVSGIFQEPSLTAIAVPSQATEYIGVLFPASPAPYYIVPRSASLSGECLNIKTPNKWVTIGQLLKEASPRRFPQSLRNEFANGQLKIFILGANDQIAISPSQIKPLISLRWDNWPDLLLPQMYENPQDTFPPLKKGHS